MANFNGTLQDGELQKLTVVNNEVTVRVTDIAGAASLNSIDTKLTTIAGLVDGLEGFTDGLEGSVDGLEALNTTLNSTASAIAASVDSLETFTDNIEPLLTALGNNTDTLEASFTTLNAKDFSTAAKQDLALIQLTAINSNTDNVEILQTSTNTKLDTLIAKDFSTSAKQDTINTNVLAQTAVLNSGIATMLDKISTTSLTVLDSAVTLNTNGASTFGVQITGTWVGQLAFEGTKDGTTWYAVAAYPHSGTGATVSTTTGNTQLVIAAGSNTQMRVRRSIATSGTAVVTVVASIGTHLMQVYQLNANNFNGTVTVPNMQVCPTSTQTTVTAGTASVALLAANANRKKVIIINESNKDIYITNGATASLTNYSLYLGPGLSTLEINQPIFTGTMSVIASGVGATLRVTELA